jgi:hypothetical protein
MCVVNGLAMAALVPGPWREGPMKAASWSLRAASWSLIVIPEHNPILEKIGMSFKAVLILATAFLVAFLMTVFLFLLYPSLRVSEPDRIRLAAENQTLRIENKNLALKILKLDTEMSHIQEHSQGVVALMQTD